MLDKRWLYRLARRQKWDSRNTILSRFHKYEIIFILLTKLKLNILILISRWGNGTSHQFKVNSPESYAETAITFLCPSYYREVTSSIHGALNMEKQNTNTQHQLFCCWDFIIYRRVKSLLSRPSSKNSKHVQRPSVADCLVTTVTKLSAG